MQENRVYELNGNAVGWIAWYIEGKNRVLEAVYVSPGHQRKGIGTQMVDFLVDQLRGIPVTSIAASVLRSGQFAVGFYRNVGFVIHNPEDTRSADYNPELRQYPLRPKPHTRDKSDRVPCA